MNVRAGIVSLMLVASGGCGGDGSEVVPDSEEQRDPPGDEVPDEPEAANSCVYTSPFTNAQECRDYVGEAWAEADIRTDCEQQSGMLIASCESQGSLGRCILNEAGDATKARIVGVAIDVTDRKGAQARVVAAETRLRAALEKRAERAFREVCGLNEDDIQQFALLSDKLQNKFLGCANRCPGKEK